MRGKSIADVIDSSHACYSPRSPKLSAGSDSFSRGFFRGKSGRAQPNPDGDNVDVMEEKKRIIASIRQVGSKDETPQEHWSIRRITAAAVVNHHTYKMVLAVAILANTVMLILETDLRSYQRGLFWDNNRTIEGFEFDPNDWLTMAGDLLLVLYVTDLVLRMYIYRGEFFRGTSNQFDFVIVSVDCLVFTMEPLKDLPSVAILRVLRMLRIVRVLRSFLVFRELYLMMQGLVSAFKSIVFATFLIAVVLILWSIVAVEFVQPYNVELSDAGIYGDCGDYCKQAFSSVLVASLTLLRGIIAGDSWGMLAYPLILGRPSTAIVLIGSLLTIQLGLLNLIIAVIVDRAASAREQDEELMYTEKKEKLAASYTRLRELFAVMDNDGGGTLDYDELKSSYFTNDEFREILDLMDVQEKDLDLVFTILDKNKNMEVSYKEFVEQLHEMKSFNAHTLLVFIRHHAEAIRETTWECLDLLRHQFPRQASLSRGKTLMKGLDQDRKMPLPGESSPSDDASVSGASREEPEVTHQVEESQLARQQVQEQQERQATNSWEFALVKAARASEMLAGPLQLPGLGKGRTSAKFGSWASDHSASLGMDSISLDGAAFTLDPGADAAGERCSQGGRCSQGSSHASDSLRVLMREAQQLTTQLRAAYEATLRRRTEHEIELRHDNHRLTKELDAKGKADMRSQRSLSSLWKASTPPAVASRSSLVSCQPVETAPSPLVDCVVDAAMLCGADDLQCVSCHRIKEAEHGTAWSLPPGPPSDSDSNDGAEFELGFATSSLPVQASPEYMKQPSKFRQTAEQVLQQTMGVESPDQRVNGSLLHRMVVSAGLTKYDKDEMCDFIDRLNSASRRAARSSSLLQTSRFCCRPILRRFQRLRQAVTSALGVADRDVAEHGHDWSLSQLTDSLGESGMTFQRFAQMLTDPKTKQWLSADVSNQMHAVAEVLLAGNPNRVIAEMTNTEINDLVAPVPASDLLTRLEPVAGFVTLVSAVVLGFQSDEAIGGWAGWAWFELLFVLFFSFDLLLRVRHTGLRKHFCGESLLFWNWLDAAILWLALVDLVMTLAAAGDFLRVLRVTRLLRLFRMFRLRMFKELTIMLKGLAGGLRTLGWAMVLLLAACYMISLSFHMLLAGSPELYEAVDGADELFSTVPRCMFTAFRCFTGDCTDSYGRAIASILSVEYGLQFSVPYIICMMLVTFGIFNLIIAIYIEATMSAAKIMDDGDRERRNREAIRVAQITKKLLVRFCKAAHCSELQPGEDVLDAIARVRSLSVEIYESEQSTCEGAFFDDFEAITITKDVFLLVIQDRNVQALMDQLDIPPERAHLFDVLDADGSGGLHVGELVQGLLKVRGQARRSDMVACILAIRAVQDMLRGLRTDFVEVVGYVRNQANIANHSVAFGA